MKTWSDEYYLINGTGSRIPAGMVLKKNEPGEGKNYLYELLVGDKLMGAIYQESLNSYVSFLFEMNSDGLSYCQQRGLKDERLFLNRTRSEGMAIVDIMSAFRHYKMSDKNKINNK